MKKTFKLTHPKTKYARLMDGVRCEVKKYIKRERRKEIPEGYTRWDFDCKFGETMDDAEVVALVDLGNAIAEAEKQQLQSFYVEIMAKPGKKSVQEGRPLVSPEADDIGE